MNILLTAIGKRVQLIKYLKRNNKVIGVDSGSLAAAAGLVDKFYNVPRFNENGYIEYLLDICRKEKVDMLIPLYESEFILLCNYREEFKKRNTELLLSSKYIIEIFNDKYNTYVFFKEQDIKTPKTYMKNEIEIKLNQYNMVEDYRFPLIVKPLNGMGSKDVFKVNNLRELDFFKDYVKNPIFQEFVDGIEFTIDVLFDLNGKVISIVPRERIEVRSGEVSKSRTVIDQKLIDATYSLCNKLNGAIGPITIQCIVDSAGEIFFIEINPRFGGGVPLTFEAGVDYGKYFEMMHKSEPIEPIIGQYKELTMLRYDEAVYLEEK